MAYLLELNSAVDGLDFMEKNINFFDGNGIFVIVLRDIKPVTMPNVSEETNSSIIDFVESPIMERLTNSLFLVIKDDSRIDIWGQVIYIHQHFKER